MSLDNKVHTALKSLIGQGLVQEVHTNGHAHYVEGGSIPDEVNVVAVLNVANPEEHRPNIEGLLHHAGLGKVVLHLHRDRIALNQPSEVFTGQAPAGSTG